jgi:hypothetical protein
LKVALQTHRAGTRELCVAVSLLLLAGLLALGPHVLDGGFTIDDWGHAAAAHLHDLGTLLRDYWGFTSNRPVLVGYVPISHLVLGESPWAHHLWSIVLAVAMSGTLYALLRRLAFAPRHAFALALLVLLFPSSDASRLWATASHIHLGIALGLGGVVLALRGLDARTAGEGRRARRLHAGALALYATSVLTYEIAGAVLLMAGALYFTRAGWSVVWRRWAADIGIIAACLLWSSIRAQRERPSLQEMLDHAWDLGNGGITVLARSALPFGSVGRQTVVMAMIAVVAAAILVWWMLPAGDDARPVLKRWLLVVAGGVLVATAGWALYIPADPYYQVDAPGVGNRTNVMAAVGIVAIVYAVLVLAATLLFRGLPRWGRPAAALSVALALLIALGYTLDLRDDERAWARADAESQAVLTALEQAVPDPAAGSTLYTFGAPGSIEPGVVVFAFRWDLVGAVKLVYDEESLAGYPILEGTVMTCGLEDMGPTGSGWLPGHRAAYGKGYFVDVPSARAERIDSRSECRAALARFVPGPAYAPAPAA